MKIAYILLIILVVLVSFGQVTLFDIWQDDNALIFKVQHPQEQVGVFGPGPIGLGAYKYVAVPYIILSNFFGLSISFFYFIGIVVYILAALTVFLLSRTLTKNNFYAVSASLIFAAGYIGSESAIRLFNSIQTSLSISFVSLLFYFLHKFSEKLKWIYYIFALFFYYISFEIGYVRVQYLILPTVIFYLFFVIKRHHIASQILKFLGLVPFTVVYFRFYLLNPDARVNLVSDYLTSLLAGKIEYLFSLFSTTGFLVFPDILQIKLISVVKIFSFDFSNRLLLIEVFSLILVLIISKLLIKRKTILITLLYIIWFYFHWSFFINSSLVSYPLDQVQSVNLLSSYFGGIAIISALCWIMSASNSYQKQLLLFLLSWFISNVFIFSIYLPLNPLETTSRYVTHSFPPLALIISSIIYGIKGERRGWLRSLSVFFAVGMLSILSFDYQKGILENRVKPIKSFYQQLKTQIPNLDKGSVIYFQVAEDSKSRKQFSDFFSVGSMPDSTAIAIRYHLDRYDIFQTHNFNELLEYIKTNNTPINKVYSIYYSSSGLIDKSDNLRQILRGKKIYSIDQNFLSTPKERLVINNLNIPAYPLTLKFSARATINNTKTSLNCSNNYANEMIKKILLYKASLEIMKNQAIIVTDSVEKNSPQSNLFDSDNRTVWRGSRGYWITNHKENITISFKGKPEISKLIWHNSFSNTTPTMYKILKSEDGSSWIEVKNVVDKNRRQVGRVIDEFPTIKTKFLRIEITDTFDDDSPAISEIDISNYQDEIPNQKLMDNFFSEQSDCIEGSEMYFFLQDISREDGVYVNISLKDSISQKLESKTAQKIKADGQFYSYDVKIPANGSYVKEIILQPLFPFIIEIKDIKFEFLEAES